MSMQFGSLGTCTFEDFAATGRDEPDLGWWDDSLRGVAGRIYADAYWITRRGAGWYTIIGNCEYRSDTLDGIERELHYFITAD